MSDDRPYMSGLTQHYEEQNAVSKPLIIYPFRLRQFLDLKMPSGVCDSGRSQHQNSDGRIFLIVKTDGHWIFLAGIPVAQTGLQWTLYDGLRLGHLVLPACCLALQFCDILQLDFGGL